MAGLGILDYLALLAQQGGGGILSGQPGASPQVAPPGQPTWMTGISDFLKQNPALISNLASGIGSAPSMRMGIAQAAAGMPQAQQADQQTRGNQAVQDYFKNPDLAKSMSPAQLKLLQANPALAQTMLANTLGAKPQWGVVSEDPYSGIKQYGWIDVGSQSIKPYQAPSVFDQPNGAASAPQGGVSPGGSQLPTPAQPAAPAWKPGGMDAMGGKLPGTGAPSTAPRMTGIGPDFDSLPPDYQKFAIKMYQGKVPFETARQLGITPLMYTKLTNAANDYAQHSNDSNGFDAVSWQNRLKTVENFNAASTSPNAPGFAIGKGRTSIGHLDQLSSLIDKLPDNPAGNVPFVGPFIRGLQIAAAKGTNSDLAGTMSSWDTTVGLLASELTNFYRGSGGNEADISRFIDQLNGAKSKTELYNAVTSAVDLMKSRIGSYQDQWHSAMGKAVPDFEIFTPTSLSALDRIQQRAQAGLAKERGGPQPNAAPTEGATATGPNGQKAVFRGGKWVDAATGQPVQ